MEEKVSKIYNLVIVVLIISSINLIMTFAGKITVKDTANTSSNTSTNTSTSTSDYDVSSFNTLTLNQVLGLFDNKNNTYVVYFGRSTCSACVSFLPTLKTMQSKYGYTTQYLDIETVDSTSSDFEKLMEKLSKEVSLTVNGESKTQAYSEYYGYTPMTFIIKNGKFVDGIVGAYNETKFETFLNDNGIK